YFIKYDGEVMYPFLSPGNFEQDNNDANHPAMKRINSSPFAAEEKYTNKATGFVEYDNAYTYAAWSVSSTYRDLEKRLPIVMLYGTQLYTDGNRTIGYQTISNNPKTGASKGKYVYCLPKMVADETMTLEIRQPVYIRSHGQYSYHSELTATVEIPTKYRMVFPESTEIRAKGNVWVGEGLKALKGLGCVTYKTSGSSYRANNEPGLPQDDLTGGDLKIQIGQKYTWLQQTHLGENGAIFDEGIKGQARDVGIYKTADGVDEVIMLTDESLRFYKKENGEYHAYDEVMMDTLKRVSGYGLKVEGDVKETHVSENAAEKTNTDTMVERVTEKAMDEEEQEYNILADNLMPYTTNRLMICHEGDGVSVFDLKGESLMKVLGGHYYRIYPTKKSGTYVLLGFQTEEYDYTQADISMSKFYTIDLGELVDSESNSNISSYIDELKDIYQSKTHTVRYAGKEGDRKIYEIVDPEETEDKEYERAVRLFTDSDTKTIEELEAICKDYDVEVTDKMKEYALDVAGKIRNQRKALIAYYELIGIQMKGERGLPDTWQYLINESEVFTASYEGMLEIMLVEMVLSDDYTDFAVTHPIDSDNLDCLIGVESSGALKKTYERYKDDYRDWQTTRKNSDTLIKVSGNEAGVDITGMDTEELTDTIVDLYSKRTEANDAGDITQMEFYQAVLSDIKMKYLRLNNPKGTADILGFDEYMVQLFNDISPDYGHDVFDSMLESGYGQFHALTGVPTVTEENQALYDWKEQDVMDDLSICRYEWQIEEVMVKYCLKLTEYKDTPAYHKAWDEYCKTNFMTLEDRQKAFQSAAFYNIIKDKQDAALSLGTGKTWSESVGDILRKVGNSPIVK
ncbi:MAG: hypothetical protein K6B44_06060, partial [Lachnospiraceae bacterium]|nr:hypothetical protein [Lachnospiraceae bacterium]